MIDGPLESCGSVDSSLHSQQLESELEDSQCQCRTEQELVRNFNRSMDVGRHTANARRSKKPVSSNSAVERNGMEMFGDSYATMGESFMGESFANMGENSFAYGHASQGGGFDFSDDEDDVESELLSRVVQQQKTDLWTVLDLEEEEEEDNDEGDIGDGGSDSKSSEVA